MRTSQEIAKLDAGAYFGELALLRHGDRSKQRRAASCIALTNCDTRILNKRNFDRVCADFPELKTYLEHEAERKYKQYAQGAKKPSSSQQQQQQQKPKTRKRPKRDSVAMVLAQVARRNGTLPSEEDKVTTPVRAWSNSITSDDGAGSIESLAATLDVINKRMARLEVSFARFTARGAASPNSAARPPPPRTASSKSEGRRRIQSPRQLHRGASVPSAMATNMAVESSHRSPSPSRASGASKVGASGGSGKSSPWGFMRKRLQTDADDDDSSSDESSQGSIRAPQ